MARYIIANGKQIFDGVNFQDPYWILVTFPYVFVDSFDRTRMTAGNTGGFRIVSSQGALTSGNETYNPILFDQQVMSWNVAGSKGSHLHSLSAELTNAENSLFLMQWVVPGDHCMFWSFNNRHDYEVIRSRLLARHNCTPWDGDEDQRIHSNDTVVNGFDSGLKFIGRITALQHHEVRLPQGGFDVGWSLQATAFSELDMTIYYNDLIAFKYDDMFKFCPDFGVSLKQFLVDEPGNNRGFVNTNTFVPAVIKVALGKGPGELSKDKGGTQVGIPSQLKSSPNVEFEMPANMMQILGRAGKRFYADVLTQMIGVQSYSAPSDNSEYKNVLPDIDSKSPDGTVIYMRRALKDYFPPDPFSFKDKSIWSFIQAYLNRPINEAYTVLKPHPTDGRLLPTVVIRRIPYSTDEYANAGSNQFLEATAFSELPRWVIAPDLIYGVHIGRSDALRFNYIHLTPATFPSKASTEKERLAYILSPPLVDETSIRRYGLRMLNTRVAGFADPTFETKRDAVSGQYSSFIADIMMDGHLRLSGQLTSCGIQDAIQIGDNVVFNGVLYHIEGLTHSGGIDGRGNKYFTTTLACSHGVPLRIIGQNDRLAALKAKRDEIEATRRKIVLEELPEDSWSTLRALENDLAELKDPESDVIYKQRNNRTDLADINLVGARTTRETRK